MKSISVLIPAFNAEGFLSEAIASVFEQSYQGSIEIVIVDDGSTDGTAGLAKELALNSVRKDVDMRNDLEIKYFHQDHSGAASARNSAVSKCTGDFIAFLDADDCWERDKLLLQTELLNGDPSVSIVFGHMTEFLSGTGIAQRKPVELAKGYLPSAMLARRKVFDQVGLFDTNLRVGEFVDWYSRATTQGLSAVMLPEVVFRRRLHDNNMGLRHQSSIPDYALALKAHLDRKRMGKS